MKLFYFWPCSILILVFFFSKEGVCQSPYYQGKTITFMQGRDPGGVGDLRNKVMYQFLQKNIPGHPTIISEYMPGGGGRKVANHVYHNVKGDGLTIGASSPGILASAVLGMAGVNFDPAKFIYLGSPFSENNNIFVTRKALGINSLEKLRERRVTLGSGLANTTISHPHGLGQELFLGPIRIDLFSPDKQLLHQLVPLSVFFFRFLVPARTNQLHALHGPINC
jgi:hypothetical protein